MYVTKQEKFCWAHMAYGVYATVTSFSACAQNGMEPILKWQLRLFPISRPLECIAINILGSVPRTAYCSQYVHGMTDRYLKATRSFASGKTSSAHGANYLFDSKIVSCVMFTVYQKDNGVRLTSNQFTVQCTMLGVNHLTTTAYHPQANQ